MRKLLLAAVIVAVASQSSLPESKAKSRIWLDPTKGSVDGAVYTNEFFGLTWEFPKDWTVKTTPTPHSGDRYYELLILFPEGNQGSEEITLSAQNLSGVNYYWHQYLDQLKSMVIKKGWRSVEERRSLAIGEVGFESDEYESVDERQYIAILARPLRNHEVKFYISARSHERLEDLVKTVIRAKFAPDWTNGVIQERFTNPPGPVSVGKLVHRVDPEYPSAARSAKIQGTVVLAAVIGKDGKIDQIYVLQGHPFLVDRAVEAVQKWRYLPYKLADGTPISVDTEIAINFAARGGF